MEKHAMCNCSNFQDMCDSALHALRIKLCGRNNNFVINQDCLQEMLEGIGNDGSKDDISNIESILFLKICSQFYIEHKKVVPRWFLKLFYAETKKVFKELNNITKVSIIKHIAVGFNDNIDLEMFHKDIFPVKDVITELYSKIAFDNHFSLDDEAINHSPISFPLHEEFSTASFWGNLNWRWFDTDQCSSNNVHLL